MGPRHCVDTVDLHKVELAQYDWSEVLSGGIRRRLRSRKCCRASLLERMSVGVVFIEFQMRYTARKSRAVILH